MATPQTSSRLQLLQARFQQKQLQEKEQKLLQLYDQQQQRAHQVAQRGSAGSNGSNSSSHGSGISNPAGKVRQMFDERRQNNAKGIDKSYPLEPLDSRSKKGTGTGAVAGKSVGASTKPGHTNVSRRNVNTRRSTRSEESRTLVQSRDSYGSNRALYKDSIGRRENISRESEASSRGDYNDASESIGQLNGHARNGQPYEINIDEVIDNDAMERNRMLAKFHSIDIEKRRRFSGDIETEQFPEEMLQDAPEKAVEKSGVTAAPRKSSQAEPRAERFKNTNTRKGNAATKKRSEPTIPAGTNARQSTVMKTTKSASLKIRKLPRDRQFSKDRKNNSSSHKSHQLKEKSKKSKNDIIITHKSDGHIRDCEKNLSTNWNPLKSTSLICEIIRNRNKVDQSDNIDKVGKVKTIVTKIESIATKNDLSSKLEKNLAETRKDDKLCVTSTSTSKKRPSIFDSELLKGTRETTKSERSEEILLKNIENEDQGDGLITREKIDAAMIRGNRESSVEHPTDCQEITIADQTIRVEKEIKKKENRSRDNIRRLSNECANRVRRASFELKRMMFEQIQSSSSNFSRRDSVESALQHFDCIQIDGTDSWEPVSISTMDRFSNERKKSQPQKSCQSCQKIKPDLQNISLESKNSNDTEKKECAKQSDCSTFRLCTKDSSKIDTGRAMKGFEKHTSSWSIKTSKEKALRHSKSLIKTKQVALTAVSGKRFSPRRKGARILRGTSKKLLEARDSIELARVSVKTKLTACRRKTNFNTNARLSTEKTQITLDSTHVESDEAEPVKSQSFPHDSRVAQLKSIFLNQQTAKDDKFSSSTTRHSNADSGAKKVDSSIKASESIARKNVIPYPSSKSPENSSEQKSRLSTKSSSTKALNRIGGSDNDIVSTEKNGLSSTIQKSVVDSADLPEDSKNGVFDEEPVASLASAGPRSTSSVSSSSSSLATNRSQGSNLTRGSTKVKSSPAAPTPARRTSAVSKTAPVNEDSLTTCSTCNRRFTSERITLHEQICAKTAQKKRKQFDTVTHRVRGTELESFVTKPIKKQSKAAKPDPPKSNWRRKHEDFINAIRSAKQMQAHVAAGGKLSDLPPPPASDTSDYIQCPHCSRKFNQAAAERHIPKCETMQHNKPPRGAPKTKR